jgi:hypothetical protein
MSLISIVQQNKIKILPEHMDFIVQENYKMLYSQNTSVFIISEFFKLYGELKKNNSVYIMNGLKLMYKDFNNWLAYINDNPIVNI